MRTRSCLAALAVSLSLAGCGGNVGVKAPAPDKGCTIHKLFEGTKITLEGTGAPALCRQLTTAPNLWEFTVPAASDVVVCSVSHTDMKAQVIDAAATELDNTECGTLQNTGAP